jgi:hypothetical protein
MAENEIIKHTKKSYAIIKSKDNDWKHKLREIFVEVLIIIFAVSVSIWLHNWSEHQHDVQEEKEFFIGFKKDLEIDIKNMTSSKTFYENTLKGINYFLRNGNHTSLNQDSISIYSGVFFNSTHLDPHIGRYEALKSSGKFKIIENKELLNNIITLHESNIRRIQELNELYSQHNQKLEVLVSQNTRLDELGRITNATEIMNRSDFRIILNISKGIITNNVIPATESGINKCNEIIDQIDKELK